MQGLNTLKARDGPALFHLHQRKEGRKQHIQKLEQTGANLPEKEFLGRGSAGRGFSAFLTSEPGSTTLVF
ncbi:MAG TPA: hypothetical protein DD706_09750, partial [Nitrospiraceae bacterium]|nr:hypothetical protein [Nitrospiraceae bacterium]